MRAAFAIALLCLRRWKWLPVGALLLGTFAARARLDPQGPAVVVEGMTHLAILAALACFVPAIISPTESSGRRDFLFGLPVPWWSVWLGRAAAYLTVAAPAVAFIALPGAIDLGVRSSWLTSGPWRWDATFVLFTALSGLATAGYASYRARLPLATAASAGAVLAGVGALYLLGRAAAYPLTGPSAVVRTLLGGMMALSILLASAVYLAAGRGDPARAAVSAAATAGLALVPVLVIAGLFNLGF
jgi:hypothetical protein